MTVEVFERRRDELLALIHGKRKAGGYRFKPARKVLIPKEGTSKMRPLGIFRDTGCSGPDRQPEYQSGVHRDI
jgi:hypothetical protein